MPLDRRELFAALSALGIGSATFHRAAAAEVERLDDDKKEPEKKEPEKPKTITAEMVKNAEWVAGITLSDDDRKAVAAALTRSIGQLAAVRKDPLPNSVAPALYFKPIESATPQTGRGTVAAPKLDAKKPESEDDLAFASVATLGELIRTKKVSSVELTKLALARLKKYDPALLCVVTLTEELALKQAEAADKLLAAGQYRGPLHGIPWGAKDLIAYPGFKTTWGAEHYKGQDLGEAKATVAKKLDDAGAVLVAKLTLGALAMGDQWFGGMTRNPWNVKQGSSGSSAGSCSAVAAGLVPFAIGSETLGSIVSPSTRCGTTGLRPTFGRVSRAGCMTLCWTMDKIGPICRSVEDAALVFGAIHGADPADPTAVDRPFDWPGKVDLKGLKVGYIEGQRKADERAELKALKDLGCELVPIKLPQQEALRIVSTILNAECTAAFDELPRGGIRDGYGAAWRGTFQQGQFITAVEYIRANRLRTQLMEKMAEVMKTVDVYVGGNDLQITNLTGHPSVCLPNGLVKGRGENAVETPSALVFTGQIHGETTLMAVAHAYQQATGHHLKRPPMDQVTKANAGV
jgi:Asp-tRNA(Asn)/Glu-tRNA(Gln) amidotransferase A subunit family amidase